MGTQSSAYGTCFALCCMLQAGCGPATKPPPKSLQSVKPVFQNPLKVDTTSGEATVRADDPGREVIYHIRWKSATVDVADQGIFAGTMDDVDGETYQRGQIASTFKAGHAVANRAEQILTLTGHVRAFSESQQATIACDKLEWHAKEEIVKAFGNIEVRGTKAILSGLNEVWATPDLKYFATPAMFRRPPSSPSKPDAPVSDHP